MVIGAFVLAVGAPLLAATEDRPALDGTWGGAKGNLTAQVIIVGRSVTGFFWRDDYLEVEGVNVSADGASLSFRFKGGVAELARTAEGAADLEVTEGRRVSHVELRRD